MGFRPLNDGHQWPKIASDSLGWTFLRGKEPQPGLCGERR